MRRYIAAVGMMALMACGGGGDAGTGPGPSHASVSGAWRVTVSNLHDAGNVATCQITNGTMTLAQSGTTFQGSYAAHLSCAAANGAQLDQDITGAVANGAVSGQAVTFDLDTPDFHFTGAASGASLAGTSRLRLVVAGVGTVTLDGTWAAVKQ